MTNGALVSRRFPYILGRVHIGGQGVDVEALLDTGFDGDVAIPDALIKQAGSPDGHSRWRLADGTSVLVPYYVGTVELAGLGPFLALVIVLGDEPLFGAGAARHVTIVLDHGRRVLLQP